MVIRFVYPVRDGLPKNRRNREGLLRKRVWKKNERRDVEEKGDGERPVIIRSRC